MKKLIFDYIKQHPNCTHHQVSIALDLNELQVLSLIRELRKNGFVAGIVRPLGNAVDPNSSMFYHTTKDVYPQQENNH